jgi:hypothetical protein
VEIGRRHHARIDSEDVEEHVIGTGYERSDFLRLMHTRKCRRRKVLVNLQMWGCIADVALQNTDILTIGRCVVKVAVSAGAAHVAPLASTESSSNTVSTIGGAGVGTLALSNSAVV